MINPTLDSSSGRFALYSLPSPGLGLVFCFILCPSCTEVELQCKQKCEGGHVRYFQNNELHALTNNRWVNKWQSWKICPYGTCLLTEQLDKERDGYKLPVKAWWCRTGHKKNLPTSLKQNKKPQPRSTFRYRTPMRAFKKVFTDKRVAEVSGRQRSHEELCTKVPSSSVTRLKGPHKAEEASPLTSLGPGEGPLSF